MDIAYDGNAILKLCTKEKEGIRKLGDKCAKKLRTRLADLQAASCLEDLREAPGHLHELKEDRKGQFSMDLLQPYRLIFVPSQEPPPTNRGGGLDWARITAVTIVEIVDYH